MIRWLNPFRYLFYPIALLMFYIIGVRCRHAVKTNSHNDEKNYKLVYWSAKLYLYIKNIKVITLGLNKEIFNKPALIICNHKSNIDPPIFIKVLSELKVRYSFVAKDELKDSKFFSKYTDIVHTIYLRRNNLRNMYDDYKQQSNAIEEGRSVIIFPEGTIYQWDNIGEFKSGAIKLAYDKKIPIISMTIYGSSGLNNYDDTKDNVDHHRNVYIALDKIYKYDDIMNINIGTLSDTIHDRLQDKYLEIKNKTSSH